MNFRYSGHGAFTCRYTWLPKIVRHLTECPTLFSDEDDAMVRLGVGKNMVRAVKFWSETTGVVEGASERNRGFTVTPFGRAIFGDEGLDQFLEDGQTFWLIHWNLCTQSQDAPFAWHFLLNHWHRSDFTKSEVLAAFEQETAREEKTLSAVTLQEHCSIFLHTYVPTRASKREQAEDSLDCPLVELDFIQEVGERPDALSGRREVIYAFRIEEKPDISSELFVYCLDDYWRTRFPKEQTLNMNQVATGVCSPGQVFKLPEHSVRERLESLHDDSNGIFQFQESASVQQIIRTGNPSSASLLRKIYRGR